MCNFSRINLLALDLIKCDDLLCAAKIIHQTLFSSTTLYQVSPERERRLPIRRFEQECEFMSAIRHSNIVQYLGIFRDADTHMPVLLMELMGDSLTHFLDRFIPYDLQVSICHDVALALSFFIPIILSIEISRAIIYC